LFLKGVYEMDEKKRKWEKPELLDIDNTLAYGACGGGSLNIKDWCSTGPDPNFGCGEGTSPFSFDCTTGPHVVVCNVGGEASSTATPPKNFHFNR